MCFHLRLSVKVFFSKFKQLKICLKNLNYGSAKKIILG